MIHRADEYGHAATDPLRRACMMLLWRTPMLIPLIVVAGVCAAPGGAGAWGWFAAVCGLVVAHVLRMRRVLLCGVLCAAVVLSAQMVRSSAESALQRRMAAAHSVALQGVVVSELSHGCILETYWPGPRVALRGDVPWRQGDVVQVVAEPLPVEEPAVSGMFSTPEWMRRQGLCANLTYLHGCKLGVSWGLSLPGRYAVALRSALADRLMPRGTESDERRQVLCALVLGAKDRSEYGTLELFRRSGCLHAFAVSGLHVGLVAGLLWGLLSLCRVPPRAGRYALLIGVGVYVFATGMAVPALRAYLMLAAVMGGLILRRRSSLFNAWCFAATLILLIEPWQLYQPGYQLSFVVYAAICLGVRYGMGDSPWFGPDAYIPPRVRTRGERFAVRAELAVRGTVVAALVAWLVSLPFCIAQFHAVSPLSYLTNMAIAPLLPLVMLTGLLALVAAPVPLIGAACQYMAVKSAGLLLGVISVAGQFPGAFLPAVEPAAPGSAMLAALSYGRSYCVLGNPGLLIGDIQREADARYRIEPALFHGGFSPSLAWAPAAPGAAALIYRRSYPQMQMLRAGVQSRHYRSAAGEYHIYYPPRWHSSADSAAAPPIVLWVRPDGMRVLYLGNAAASTLENMPPEERRADVIILGMHPREPVLDAQMLRSMSPGRVILLPAAQKWPVPDHELAPARVERLSAEEQPAILLK